MRVLFLKARQPDLFSESAPAGRHKVRHRSYVDSRGVFHSAHEQYHRGATPRRDTGGDQVVVMPYMAGSNRPRDFEAAIRTRGGVGVVVGELSERMRERVADAVASGREVFVDSGAFGMYTKAARSGQDIGTVPFEGWVKFFDGVLRGYEDLSARVLERDGKPSHAPFLMLVAPDVIGDQGMTLSLLVHYKARLERLQEAGHEIIVPMQVGKIPAGDFYHAVRVLVFDGLAGFVPGIPSAKEAMSAAEFEQFIGDAHEPPRLHILGAASPGNRAFQERMDVIRRAYVDEVPGVTADSMRLRAVTSKLKALHGDAKLQRMTAELDRSVPAMWRVR